MSLLLLFRPRGGGGPPPPPPPAPTPPSGVRHSDGHKRQVRIRLSDGPREELGEFLKKQLKLRHTDPFESERSAAAERKRLAGIAQREAAMRAAAEKEAQAQKAAQEKADAERRAVDAYNREILKLIFLSNL